MKMDYTIFTDEQLEVMLKEHKDKLVHMIMISGVEALTERIKEIEFTLKERNDDKAE